MTKWKGHAVPEAGTRFPKKYKKKHFFMDVVTRDGQVGYKVGKSIFSSPSAAAKSITGGHTNGWVFWGIVKRPK